MGFELYDRFGLVTLTLSTALAINYFQVRGQQEQEGRGEKE